MTQLNKAIRQPTFVLTAEEKRVICFVLLAFLIGFGTKYYRDKHPQPLPPPSKSSASAKVKSSPSRSRIKHHEQATPDQSEE